MIKKIVTVLSVSVLFSQNGFAAIDRNITLKGIGCFDNGVCFANLSKATAQSCDKPNQVRWDGTTSIGKNLTATVLTAKASGAKVNVGTVDGTCNGIHPVLNYIAIL